MQLTEGTVPFRGYRTWYQVAGPWPAAEGKPPLLVQHGGPGFPHDYLEDLNDLTSRGRTVVFYDQIGCGKSDHPDDPALWTVETWVEEIRALRKGLGLDRIHVLGHSWGGCLALEYALRRPEGLASLVLAGACASMPLYAAEARRLKDSLPAEVRETLDRHEAQGTTDSAEYQEASMAFYTRWMCRLNPYPDHLMRSFSRLNAEIYGSTVGAEWNITGTLKDWDVTDRLGEITLPVLVTSGGDDLMTPAVVQPLVDGIAGAEWVVFENSAHMTTVEEPVRYRETVDTFLTQVESAKS